MGFTRCQLGIHLPGDYLYSHVQRNQRNYFSQLWIRVLRGSQFIKSIFFTIENIFKYRVLIFFFNIFQQCLFKYDNLLNAFQYKVRINSELDSQTH